jgi:hypothetical protein
VILESFGTFNCVDPAGTCSIGTSPPLMYKDDSCAAKIVAALVGTIKSVRLKPDAYSLAIIYSPNNV